MSADLQTRLLALVDDTPQGRALAAVLRRHAPDETAWRPLRMADVRALCAECADEDVTWIGADMQRWPCPTVQDIAAALGVELSSADHC